MRFPCASPFTLARILANGDVQLCYKFVVGNLHANSFEDIWYGDCAHQVRLQLMANDCTCRSCDYFRFALKYNEMDLEDRRNYFSGNIVDYANGVAFDNGAVLVQVAPAAPRLVESIGVYNVVYYNRRYFGVPQAAGPLEVDSEAISKVDGVFIDASLGKVRAAIRERLMHR